jgi:hypothetical protein
LFQRGDEAFGLKDFACSDFLGTVHAEGIAALGYKFGRMLGQPEEDLQGVACNGQFRHRRVPTERGRKPLVVYIGRSRPTDSSRDFLGTFSGDGN